VVVVVAAAGQGWGDVTLREAAEEEEYI